MLQGLKNIDTDKEIPTKRVNCVMLVDDNSDDNFFHQRLLLKHEFIENVIALDSAEKALEYLEDHGFANPIFPDIIFLDINMPGMNGWDFLQEIEKKDYKIHENTLIFILTTSVNPDDVERAKSIRALSGLRTKPLTAEVIRGIVEAYF